MRFSSRTGGIEPGGVVARVPVLQVMACRSSSVRVASSITTAMRLPPCPSRVQALALPSVGRASGGRDVGEARSAGLDGLGRKTRRRLARQVPQPRRRRRHRQQPSHQNRRQRPRPRDRNGPAPGGLHQPEPGQDHPRRLSRTRADSTVASILSLLSMVLGEAVEEKRISTNPCRKLR
jgi:hypothetical protein